MEGPVDTSCASLCNSLSLQTDKRGFFLDYANGVTDVAEEKNWLQSTFAKLKNDEDRIRACFENREVAEAIQSTMRNIEPLYRKKSGPVSRQKMAEGMSDLDVGRQESALALLSQSVIRAPPKESSSSDEPILATALSSRAEVLMELREYDLALSDIQLAMKEGFPEHQKFQLFWRMARCYRNLGQLPKATVALQLAQKLLEQQKEQLGHKYKQCVQTLQQEMQTVENCDSDIIQAQENKSNNTQDPKKDSPDTMSGRANCVGVSYSEEFGNYALAKAPIPTGYTVATEDPYAACLLPEMFGTHCHHCFKRLRAPVACPNCSGLAFCSTQCRDEACCTYHKYECKYMDIFIGSGMSILCHVALRMITQFDLNFFHIMEKNKDCSTKVSKKNAEAYKSISNLVTHPHLRATEDFFHRTLMAIFLLTVLQKTGFFPEASNSTSLNEDQLLIAKILLRSLQLLQFNAHEIYETVMKSPNKFRGARPHSVGVGIYPSVCLFNHDCYPALARFFIGKTIVLRTLRPLEEGDLVAENYGPAFVKFPLIKRKKMLLSKYWFHCKCQACCEDWPVFENQDNSFHIKCTTKGCTHLIYMSEKALEKPGKRKKPNVKCSQCYNKINMVSVVQTKKEAEVNYEKGLEVMESGDAAAAIPLFCSYLDQMHSIGRPPHKNLHLCQEALRICMADYGNKWVVPNVC